MPIYDVYIGTYSEEEPHVKGEGRGIHWFQWDSDQSQLSTAGEVETAFESGPNPSFLCLTPKENWIYATSEKFEQKNGTLAINWRFDTGHLSKLGEVQTDGCGPCHVSVSKDGSMIIVSNYHSGNVIVYTCDEKSGQLKRNQFFQFATASGVVPDRQESTHAHWAGFEPHSGGKVVYITDLGGDRIFQFIVAYGDSLKPMNDREWVECKSGCGPRHLAFHPTNPSVVYLSCELSNEVGIFTVDSKTHGLEPVGYVSTLPTDFHGENGVSEIAVHPNGRFLYVANRGHDSIAMFSISEDGKTLHLIGNESSHGKCPRHFAITPEGKHMIVGNQNSNSLVLFAIDEASGKLKFTGTQLECPTPACVLFAERKE